MSEVSDLLSDRLNRANPDKCQRLASKERRSLDMSDSGGYGSINGIPNYVFLRESTGQIMVSFPLKHRNWWGKVKAKTRTQRYAQEAVVVCIERMLLKA